MLAMLVVMLFRPGSYATDTLNVMVVYTEKAGIGMGGADSALDKVMKDIDSINIAFNVNAIDGYVNLVYTGLSTIKEASCMYDMLNMLMTVKTPDSRFINLTRNLFSADIVVVIVDLPPQCGISGDFNDPSQAFAVVDYRCMGANYSMARQIGYLLGCGNNESQSGRFNYTEPDAFAFYYENEDDDSNSFSTIMGYTDERISSNEVDFDMIPAWSDPNQTYNKIPIGDSTHNNARVIRNSLSFVSKYRNAYGLLQIQNYTIQPDNIVQVGTKRKLEMTGFEMKNKSKGTFTSEKVRIKKARFAEGSEVHIGQSVSVH